MNDVAAIASQYSGLGIWAVVLAAFVALLKTWPAIRKLALDSEASLQSNLLKRVSEVESQLVTERIRCTEEMAEMRKEHAAEVRELRAEIASLHRMIAQHSQSAAVLMNDPDKVAGTQAARKRRGEGE